MKQRMQLMSNRLIEKDLVLRYQTPTPGNEKAHYYGHDLRDKYS